MGARINYLFNEGAEEPAVWLYSHWGETDWQVDIANALMHARPRWQDTSYAIRNIISKLIKLGIRTGTDQEANRRIRKKRKSS